MDIAAQPQVTTSRGLPGIEGTSSVAVDPLIAKPPTSSTVDEKAFGLVDVAPGLSVQTVTVSRNGRVRIAEGAQRIELQLDVVGDLALLLEEVDRRPEQPPRLQKRHAPRGSQGHHRS